MEPVTPDPDPHTPCQLGAWGHKVAPRQGSHGEPLSSSHPVDTAPVRLSLRITLCFCRNPEQEPHFPLEPIHAHIPPNDKKVLCTGLTLGRATC